MESPGKTGDPALLPDLLETMCAKLRLLLPELMAQTRHLEAACGHTEGAGLRAKTLDVFGVVNNVMDLVQLGRGALALQPVDTDFRELVRRILQGTRPYDRDRVELAFEVSNTVPDALRLDSLRFHQVVLNLLNNALAATERGFVALQVTVESLDTTACVLRCAVTDSGRGMGAAQLPGGVLGVEFEVKDSTLASNPVRPQRHHHHRQRSLGTVGPRGASSEPTRRPSRIPVSASYDALPAASPATLAPAAPAGLAGPPGFGLLLAGRLLSLMDSGLEIRSSLRGGGTEASFKLRCELTLEVWSP